MSRTEILSKSLLFILFLAPLWSEATSTGSNTAPSREAFVLYSGTGNTINGFAGMYNGFALQDKNTAVTFNSSFPVGATMSLQGGTLTLSQSLFLGNNLVFGAPGTIIGNNNLVEFAPQNQTISLPYWLGALNLLTNHNAGQDPTTVGWSPDGQYVALGDNADGPTGSIVNVYLFNGLSLIFTASSLPSPYGALAWQPGLPPSYYFVAASYGAGGLYAYQLIPPSTLICTDNVNTGSSYIAVAWHPAGNIVAVSQASGPTQQIQIFNFNAGVLTPNTSYSFADPTQSTRFRGLAFDYSGNYLLAGCVNANQLQIFRWNGISLISTVSANTGMAINTVAWSPDGTLIAVGGASGLLQIYNFNRNTSTLTLLPSYNISLSPAQIAGIDWSPDGRTLAVVSHYGNQLQLLAVNLVKQKLVGIGQANGVSTALTEVKWSPNGAYLLTGGNDARASIFNLLPMNLQNTKLVFNSPAKLQSGFVCTGTCIIDCNGYTLDLNSQILTVTTGASLLLRNITLEGITGTNLQCIDSTGTISFKNATCVVNNTMQWNNGALAFIGDCTMTGTGTFIYSSNQTSTIYHSATWFFDRGMTFSYYPQGGANNLINFADNTAQLHLYETALHAQSNSLQFTKGIVAIEGRCPFYSDAVVASKGILFGDNLASANNVNLMILPESGIDCRSGYVVDQNIGG